MQFSLDVNIHFPVEILEAVKTWTRCQKPIVYYSGGDLMFRAKCTHEPAKVTITPFSAKDAEGNTIPGVYSNNLSSDNTAVISIEDDGSGSQQIVFGNPGVASVSNQIKNEAGDVVATKVYPFELSVGDPAVFEGGDVTFGDLVDGA